MSVKVKKTFRGRIARDFPKADERSALGNLFYDAMGRYGETEKAAWPRAYESGMKLARALKARGNVKAAQLVYDRIHNKKKLLSNSWAGHGTVYRTVFGSSPKSMHQRVYPTKAKKTVLLAELGSRGHTGWFQIDKMKGTPDYGKPWVIEVGMGYSSYYYLVWADNESDAIEIAEEEWPNEMFDEVDESDVGPLDSDGYPEDQDLHPHPSKRNHWVRSSENLHLSRAKRVAQGRIVPGHGNQAHLKTGEIVEYYS